MQAMICLTSLLSVLVLHTAAAEPGKVLLRWYGQSFFVIESSKGTRIAIDPHGIDAFGRVSVRADLILITHLHTDHTQIDVIENRDKARILFGLKNSGRRTDWNPIDERFRDVHIRSVALYHDNVAGMENGKNTAFVIDVDDMRIVHLGDLGHLLTDSQIHEMRPVDVLLIPVGGVYTINGAEAKKVVQQLQPRLYILPMHYGNEVYDELMPIDEFLEEEKPATIHRTPQTNSLVIDPQFQPPAPIKVILGWK
jgi:L-ascorbate metabolism protein UlaG (beta-lactamase superfamily)